jgi:hypothetical protein
MASTLELLKLPGGEYFWPSTPEVKVANFADKIKFRSEGFGAVSSFAIGFLGTMLLGHGFENKGK